MRIALLLRGRHYLNNQWYYTDFSESCENINSMIIQPLRDQGHTVDIFCCTYTSHKLEQLIDFYKPVMTLSVNESEFNGLRSCACKYIWCLEGSRLIREYEEKNKFTYDYIINMRFDIIFSVTIINQSYDITKMNIMFKHTSGNCDDNYWIIGRTQLGNFENAINQLLSNEKSIIHEFNHHIDTSNVNYMYETDSNEYRYYTFNRKTFY